MDAPLLSEAIQYKNLRFLSWFARNLDITSKKSEAHLVHAAENDDPATFRWLLENKFPLPIVLGGRNRILNNKKLMEILEEFAYQEPYNTQIPLFKDGF